MPLDNSIGGAGAAPGSYQKVGAVSTLKIVSGTQTVDAVRMTVQETMFGVLFSFTVTKAIYDALGWQTLASEYAAVVQSLGEFEGTQGIVYVPDVNAAQQIIDTLIVTVGTPDGLVSIDVQIPLSTTNVSANYDKVVNAYNAAIANLATIV